MARKGKDRTSVSEEDRQLLGVASLFHGTFSIDWIQDLTGKKASQVLKSFESAVQHGIAKHEGIGLFSFVNSQTAQSFHAYLTSDEEKTYNRNIVGMLIRELPDSPQKAVTIAPYLLHIFNSIETCRWLMNAAYQYRLKFQIEHALTCFVKILDDLSDQHEEDADCLFCDAAIEYAKLNTAGNDVKKVVSLLKNAMIRAKRLNNTRYQSLIDMNIAKNKWLQSQYKSALAHYEHSLILARELADESLLKRIAHFKTFLLYWQGLFKDAVLDYEQSLSDVERFPYGRFPLLAAMTVGTCYAQIGQVTQGIGMIDSIRRHCREKGDIGLAAHSGMIVGAIMIDVGHVKDALQYLIPSVKEARKIQPDWSTIQGELMLAYAYFLNGENEKCRLHIGHFYKLSNQVHVSVRPWPYLMELCWAIEQGHLPSVSGINSIRQEVEDMVNGENIFLKGVAYRFKALLEKKDGVPHDKIINTLNQSIESLKISGHAIELAKTRLELTRLYLLQGNQELALETAKPAFSILSSLNENLIPTDLKSLLTQSDQTDSYFTELVSIYQDLSLASDSREALQYIISTANRITGAERGGIFLLEDPGQSHHLTLRASKNLTQDQINLPEFHPSMTLMGDVVASGKGKVQGMQIQDNADSLGEAIILSSICVPIILKNETLGVLYHDNRLLSNAFNESLLSMLSSLASYAAVVLENDNLQKENSSLIEEIARIYTYYEEQGATPQPPHCRHIIGESPEMKQVLSKIGEVAPSNTTVLIQGETGVGKELVAQAIVNNSRRKEKPFVTLNCSALSEKLIYSELFGHEKGSFTGADHRHIGRFEKAHGGTLFLDEIGDLPLDMQVRLLRVLETKEFERVGGKETIHSDFRLITATNRNLEHEIQNGTFRSDLFYRINVFPISVPPLREHPQDVPLLIDHFLKEHASNSGKRPPLISDEEMMLLMQHRWSGNVRELKNCVERYVTTTHGRINDLLHPEEHQSVPLQGNAAMTLQENERRHIEWALKQTRGKVHGPGGAAELLDIKPNTLAYRLKKLGISKSGKR